MAEKLAIRILDRIDRLEAGAWDACDGANNPFVSHAFLAALEQSRSVGKHTGWLPQHLVIEDARGQVEAVAPLYVKSHSQGEYVFDHGWADAYERAGGRYYPKLQLSVPFTPVPGPRLLVRDGLNAEALRSALTSTLVSIAEQSGFSSAHVTFVQATDLESLKASGFLVRSGLQYHWFNRGYETFEHFLGELISRKRKAIRKERQAVARHGLKIRAFEGAELATRHWDAFFSFYMDTGGRKWGRPYLTREFFDAIGQTLADRIVLVLAEDDGRLVAGALNLKGADALYGRNWGCLADYPFLHFELCYYQAIEYAIAHRLARVEAGAQGEHKIQRGYLPVETWSAHWIAHPQFRSAVDDFLTHERRMVQHDKAMLLRHSPFRQENVPG